MGEGSQKTISCTKAWVCLLKNISIVIVFFIFVQTNQVFAQINSTLCWSSNFRHNLFTFFPFDILCILGVYPVPLCFFIWTSKTLMSLSIFLFIYLPIYLFIYLFIFWRFKAKYLFIYLFVYLFLYLVFECLKSQNVLTIFLFSMKPLHLPTAKITPGVNNFL